MSSVFLCAVVCEDATSDGGEGAADAHHKRIEDAELAVVRRKRRLRRDEGLTHVNRVDAIAL